MTNKHAPVRLLAAGLAAAAATTAQADVRLYGRVDMSFSYQSRIFAGGRVVDESVKALDSGGFSGSRIGFSGREDLGNGYRAFFVLEQGIQADTGVFGQGGRAFGRRSYVGIEGAPGVLVLGRQYTLWFETLSASDPFNNNLLGNSGNVEFANARVDNAIVYKTPALAGFTGHLLASAGEGTTGRQTNAAVHWQKGPLWVGVVGGEFRFGADGSFGLAGASYDFGPVKLFANAARIRDLNPVQLAAPVLAPGARAKSWLLGASARVAGGTMMGSVVNLDDERPADRDARQYAVGYTYPLSRRTLLYAATGRIVNRNGGTLTVNTPSYPGRGERQTQAGISHAF